MLYDEESEFSKLLYGKAKCNEKVVEKKLEFSYLFRDNVRLVLPDEIFELDRFHNLYERFFGEYAEDIYEDVQLKIQLLAYVSGGLSVRPAFPPYEPTARISIVTSGVKRAVIGMGAMTLIARYLNQKLVNDYLSLNLKPLYKRLTKINGLIPFDEEKSFESFVYLNISKHIIGERTDVSDTIYSYFLEAERIFKGEY